MTLDGAKSFRKALLFWLASVLVIGILLFFNAGVPLAPILLGAVFSLVVMLVRQFAWRKK